jgi:signal transduction histidine kinase
MAEELRTLRARIAGSLAWAACVFGLLALVPSVIASFVGGRPLIAVADVAIYAWVLAIRVAPFSPAQRSVQIVALLHIVGVIMLAALGPFGHGVMWGVGATVVAATLLGTRAAVWSAVVQALIIAATTMVLFAFGPSWWIVDVGARGEIGWLAFAGCALFLSATCSVPIGKLVSGLDEALSQVQADAVRRERLERELRQAKKLEAIGVVAGSIAHDFNNLLQPILSLTELAREEVPTGSQARADLDEVLSAGARARELVHQMSSYARREERPRQPLSLSGSLKTSMPLLKASVPRSVQVEIRKNGDVDDTVVASDGELQQVLLNLAANAAYAMKTNGGKLSLDVDDCRVEDAGLAKDGGKGFVKLAVADEGQGMDASTVEHVFEPFFTTKPQGDGTGLGLATVHNIVTSMGGAISVASELGKGTRFTLVFPRA